MNNNFLLCLVVLLTLQRGLGGHTPLTANQGVTYSKCEVRGDAGLCRFGFKDLWGVFDHVQWGSGNYSLKGTHSGAFTPKIIHKDPDFYDAEVGYIKVDDSLRDVYTCETEFDNEDLTFSNTKCRYLTIPGWLFSTAKLPGERGSGVSRSHEWALRRYVPNGACILMYVTEYEVVDTSVSPPRVREVRRMSARQARVENNCVLFYAQF
ncbi:unnamed protein product [Agarophyton chilense]|eukprot:gb/GEZJ01003570.1/.p1 GENE.gb/GEZJ01003570.1/~~gb/GEZJ01003570.1/.p1  ORF type:complete len:208 (+),score=21.83 gb/GEZJ01003570.1/:472-1095(+)